ncbi:unnamed protein product, partial [Oppiella nova]
YLFDACLDFFDENVSYAFKTFDNQLVGGDILLDVISRETFGAPESDIYLLVEKWIHKYRIRSNQKAPEESLLLAAVKIARKTSAKSRDKAQDVIDIDVDSDSEDDDDMDYNSFSNSNSNSSDSTDSGSESDGSLTQKKVGKLKKLLEKRGLVPNDCVYYLLSTILYDNNKNVKKSAKKIFKLNHTHCHYHHNTTNTSRTDMCDIEVDDDIDLTYESDVEDEEL